MSKVGSLSFTTTDSSASISKLSICLFFYRFIFIYFPKTFSAEIYN